jgi:glucosamine 6-phosphate synthetase-like amidotransferase/phosphosugar isomerase protein
MCGIAGFSISNSDHRKIKSRQLAKKLLLEIVARGEDATGGAWTEALDGECKVFYSKEAMPAEEFTEYLDMIPLFTRTAILHTRYATKGLPANNDNNHPIVIPNKVVGVHNGVITNDDELFETNDWERIAEVDSEVIFQMIANSEEPLTELPKLIGRAAIAWFDVDDPQTLHLARLKGSPLVIGHTYGDSLIFASTENLLRLAVREAKMSLKTIWEVPEMLYLKVQAGEIVSKVPLGQQVEKPSHRELFPLSGYPLRPYKSYAKR